MASSHRLSEMSKEERARLPRHCDSCSGLASFVVMMFGEPRLACQGHAASLLMHRRHDQR